jgi:peroxiredoxin
MKKLYLVTTLILLCCGVSNTHAQKLKEGTPFQLDKLTVDKKAGLNTIVAFVPSLQYENEYASMMTQGFYHYFDQRYAFEGEGFMNKPETQIVYVVRDKQDDARSIPNIMGGAKAIYDENGELFSFFGVKQSPYKNFDSTVLLIDKTGKIAYIDDSYRSQGEHLKPLENKLKELSGIQVKAPAVKGNPALKIGAAAPDFQVNEKEKLSDLRGYVVLLSFYPAAFSGTIPRRYQSGDEASLATVNYAGLRINQLEMMTCAIQISSLDKKLKAPRSDKPDRPKNEARRIAISSSTPMLLQSWKGLLGTTNFEYANDPDYSVARSYSAYNPLGYSNRVSVIVDRKGRIAYVDTDFSLRDEQVLNRKIEELLSKR